MYVANTAFDSLEAALIVDDVVDALPVDSMLDLICRSDIEQSPRDRRVEVLERLRREFVGELPVLIVFLIQLGQVVVARYQLQPLWLYSLMVEIYIALPWQVWLLGYSCTGALSSQFVAVGPFFLLLRNVGHHWWKHLLLYFLHYP